MSNIVDTVKSFLLKYSIDLTKQNSIVAFSGGYDSMCLLHILAKIDSSHITAIHLNHGWRAKESDNEEIKCKNFCNSIGVKFYSEMLDKTVPRTETAARDARYKFFRDCALKFSSDIVFTAHNLDDNAETLIYRFLKGTGVHGMCGIAASRDIFYRPLLKVCRSDIENYCNENKLSPNFDSSNNDISYNRNYIRHKIIPLLKNINSDAVLAINSFSEIANSYDKFISELALKINDSTEAFRKADKVVQFYVIQNLLSLNNIDYDYQKIQELADFIINSFDSKSGRKMSVGPNLFLFSSKDKFEIIGSAKKNMLEVSINKEGNYGFGKYLFSIEKCSVMPEKFPLDSQNCAYVNIDDINFKLRTRRDGDLIVPLGLNGSQKLKKYLNEKKVPVHIKENLILLAKDNEILWIPGIGLSDKIKVTDKVTHCLSLKERAVYND